MSSSKKNIIDGMVKWLDHFYGKPELIEEDDYNISIEPFEFYNPLDGETHSAYKFVFEKSSGNLIYFYEVGKELALYFNVGGLTVGEGLETWFEKKFGYEVVWLGNWS